VEKDLKANPASLWDEWVNLIVPNLEHAQKLYENPSGCTDPAVVQYQLALDSLFVVAFFQHKAFHDALDGFTHLFKTNRFQFAKLESDFLQVENQVPMEILKAMTMQLCDIHKNMPEIREKDPHFTDQEVARILLDVVLKKAVIYLHLLLFLTNQVDVSGGVLGGLKMILTTGGCRTLTKTILLSVLILLIQTDL